MAEKGDRVLLNVYDLSQGLARQLSTTFLGNAIEGIWHTGVVVYGNEYYFGGGIQHDPAGRTPYGTPVRVVELGETHVPKEVFEDYLKEISSRYTAGTYRLLSHNCNNFSNEVAQFLVGAAIPDYIIQLPNEVTSSPIGHMIMPMIQQLETTLRSGAVPQAPQFVPTSSSTRLSSPTAPARPIKTSVGSDNKVTETKDEISQVPPAVKPQADAEKVSAARDPLSEARNKVQDEITKEFAAIMATGTLRASEAATLAARRVMQRYRKLDVQG